MEQNMLVGPPEPGSAREGMFQDYFQQLKDTIQKLLPKGGMERKQREFHLLMLYSSLVYQMSKLVIQ